MMSKPALVSHDCDDDAPETETREERFRRIGRKRVSRMLKEIDLIGNLTGQNYKFGEAEVASMFTALETALNTTRARFDAVLAHASKEKTSFDF